MIKKLKIIISMVILLIIFSFAVVCSDSESPDGEEDTIILKDEEKTLEEGSEQEEDKESDETKTGMNEEAEYILSVGNLLTRIGDHIILIGEVMDDYDYGDITLEELKAYIGDFIMMFNESYYPGYLDLEPPIGYEEHIGRSTEYFQGFIDSSDEDEMLDNLDKALLEVEQGNKWVEKTGEEID